ncbi:DNA gyrase inhibitor YacG [Salinisphaera sp. T31B1]|uniref:DNA gyrase inhibitor YacG n=1 Tax=Salinisphaera sp. T31B1 TaxID=727963 RepID=UPI003340927B
MTQAKTIDCPYCGEPARIGADNPYRPFCSRRCKLIDLGDWLDESNRIADPSGSAGTAPWDGSRPDESGQPH